MHPTHETQESLDIMITHGKFLYYHHNESLKKFECPTVTLTRHAFQNVHLSPVPPPCYFHIAISVEILLGFDILRQLKKK